MSDRPYLSDSVEQLETRATSFWSDKKSLLAIGNELQFRKSARASGLRQRIEKRLTELSDQSRARKGSAQSGPSGRDGSHDQLVQDVKRLTGELSKAKAEIEAQRSTIVRLRGELAQTGPRSPNSDLFAKVHLLELLPDFVVRPVHNAFRKAYHPDRRLAEDKAQAHEAFVAIDRVFEQIQKLRGMA